MDIKTLFENKELMVISKPSGWVVNSAQTTKNNPVVQDWVAKNFSFETAKDFEFRNGIVHRLDKETSGVLIIAKTKLAFKALQEQFKNREVEKTYIALVHGIVEPEKGEINVEVGRLPWNRERFGILPGGRVSQTHYETLKTFEDEQGEKFSLLKLLPKTGRTHQIRIHLKHIHHPIVADTFYAGRKTSRKDRKWCPRLFLHSKSIEFTDPTSSKKIEVECDLPKDLEIVLKSLKEI